MWRRILAGALLLVALSSCTAPSQTLTSKPVDYAAIINSAKYSQTARRSPCPIAPFVACVSMRRVRQAVPFVTRSRRSASR